MAAFFKCHTTPMNKNLVPTLHRRGRQKKEKERQQAEEAAKHSNASSNVKH